MNHLRWAPRISAAHAWGDVALLHGMACACGVDVVLFYNGGRYVVGQSYLPKGLDDAECLGTATLWRSDWWLVVFVLCWRLIVRTISIATIDLVHFWPLKVDDDGQLNKQIAEHEGEVEKNIHSSWLATSEGEMGLVQCLTTWSPWQVPSAELVENMQIALGNCTDLPLSSRARQLALSELAREDALYAEPWLFSLNHHDIFLTVSLSDLQCWYLRKCHRKRNTNGQKWCWKLRLNFFEPTWGKETVLQRLWSVKFLPTLTPSEKSLRKIVSSSYYKVLKCHVVKSFVTGPTC